MGEEKEEEEEEEEEEEKEEEKEEETRARTKRPVGKNKIFHACLWSPSSRSWVIRSRCLGTNESMCLS